MINAQNRQCSSATTSDYLCKESPSDEDLHHHGDDQLKDEQHNGDGTLLGDAPETVANCGLRLQREEEGSCQGLHLHYTWGMVGRRVELWRKNRRSCIWACKQMNQWTFCPCLSVLPGLSHALSTRPDCVLTRLHSHNTSLLCLDCQNMTFCVNYKTSLLEGNRAAKRKLHRCSTGF